MCCGHAQTSILTASSVFIHLRSGEAFSDSTGISQHSLQRAIYSLAKADSSLSSLRSWQLACICLFVKSNAMWVANTLEISNHKKGGGGERDASKTRYRVCVSENGFALGEDSWLQRDLGDENQGCWLISREHPKDRHPKRRVSIPVCTHVDTSKCMGVHKCVLPSCPISHSASDKQSQAKRECLSNFTTPCLCISSKTSHGLCF